jgi:predicted AlkP superfamily pyrophosphatase or phosphodiesterase
VTALRDLLLACALALLGGCVAAEQDRAPRAAAEMRAPVTILVSIDGVRPDYLSRGITPNLNALAAAGVKAEMRPSFPTKTFPNHYTIVTGLRPDRHGIVDNNMADPARPDVTFSLGNATQALDPFWWNGAEPLWATAEKAGIRTATTFWPGSEVAIQGTRPSNWLRFDQNVTGAQRVETVIDWMRRPAANRPLFVTLYFDTVDTAGHDHGPDAAETNAALAEVDARIGDLVAGLKALGQPANLVILSDHGMSATSAERVVPLQSLVDPAKVKILVDGPYAALQPVAGADAEVWASLSKPRPHVVCWRKQDIPKRFHYGSHPRVPPFFCLAESGWTITNPAREPRFGGAHGYDNEAADMQTVFIASGPGIAKGAALPLFDNIHVYPFLARLFGVSARPSDGDAAVLAPALR